MLQAHAWNPLAKKEGIAITVNAPFLELRTGPGRGFPVTHVIERGDNLQVKKSKTDWYLVSTTQELTGWVHAEELDGSLLEDGSEAQFSRSKERLHEERRWELGMAAGDFSGARSLSTSLQYHLTENISSELRYTHAFGDSSNIKLYGLNAIHQPFPKWRFSPFVTLGAGFMQTQPHSELAEAIDREDNTLMVGGGLFIYASRNFMLRTEYNSHTVLTSRADNEEVHEWKAGFSVFF